MPVIEHQQLINAPVEVCFDLARNVDIHTQTTSKTKERAVSGVTEGLLEQGDTVTREAIHFGIKQRLTAALAIGVGSLPGPGLAETNSTVSKIEEQIDGIQQQIVKMDNAINQFQMRRRF
ncbi:hypothetical protein DFO70_1344 [Cytobacillus firmus]|uniref:Uncharacterized protein n=2 Tax=Cytobacillus TaxID=2675230 RepID=A0A366JGE2_CYTFI|nr:MULTISPECIES: hypothetical protein [Cytobacillus]RBP86056.1 hypothetical protein DFO70_1344 [Cytobacillus firmus]TDX35399.1 hypothetical protein DFO72_1304 [Cytobacillus oceanisediminis]